jgi:hypothetical protein
MDAARLGRASPLPGALLLDASVSYLTGLQRTKDIATLVLHRPGLGHVGNRFT